MVGDAHPEVQSGSFPVELTSEFAAVRVTVDRQGRAARLCVVDLETGDNVFLDALQLASMCHADDEQQQTWLRTGEYSGTAR